MLKLIKLEYRKNNIKKYIVVSTILTALLTLFIFAMTYWGIARDPGSGVVETAMDGITVSSHIELLSMGVFLVLASVMQSTFIVEAYKNKTMDLMFQYPIQRKKILISKMLAVLIFSVISLLLCKYIIYTVIYAASFTMTADFSVDVIKFSSLAFHTGIILQSLSTVCLSILSLYAGLLFKSTKAPIITAFLLFAVTQGGFGDFSLAGNKGFALILIVLSILCAFLCMMKIETKDVDAGQKF
jgi:ABC-type transport system involved in multi-copper enzyme maturation permease subunit